MFEELTAPTAASAREEALRTLGKTVGTLPFDAEAVRKACMVVEEEGGPELAVEACSIVGAFESITRVADATGRRKPPQGIMRVVKVVNLIVLGWRRLLLVISMLIVLAVAIVNAGKT